jgi:hypothetical protein
LDSDEVSQPRPKKLKTAAVDANTVRCPVCPTPPSRQTNAYFDVRGEDHGHAFSWKCEFAERAPNFVQVRGSLTRSRVRPALWKYMLSSAALQHRD